MEPASPSFYWPPSRPPPLSSLQNAPHAPYLLTRSTSSSRDSPSLGLFIIDPQKAQPIERKFILWPELRETTARGMEEAPSRELIYPQQLFSQVAKISFHMFRRLPWLRPESEHSVSCFCN